MSWKLQNVIPVKFDKFAAMVLGKMPPGKMPPGKMPLGKVLSGKLPSGNKPPRKIAPGKLLSRKIAPGKLPPPKKSILYYFFMLWNILAVKISLILIFVSLNFCGL